MVGDILVGQRAIYLSGTTLKGYTVVNSTPPDPSGQPVEKRYNIKNFAEDLWVGEQDTDYYALEQGLIEGLPVGTTVIHWESFPELCEITADSLSYYKVRIHEAYAGNITETWVKASDPGLPFYTIIR